MAHGERRRTLARLRQIAQVATRHGFGYVFARNGAEEDPGDPAGDTPSARATRGERLREMLEELGPTFVKFGQLLSTRPDVVPPDITQELRKLQDEARPEPFEAIRGVVEEELGLTLEQAFEAFDEVPIGSASVGQVHVARLPGGREVVVKVQRPGANDTLNADIDLLYRLARMARDRVKRLSFIDLEGLVDEFAKTVRQELDYRNEARNNQVVGRNFAGNPHVAVPQVHWRQSTGRVLTQDRLDGPTLAHVDLALLSVEERRTLASRIAETWMQMVFADGMFHADPHPANIIILGPDRIGLIDFGMVGLLSQSDREAAVRLFTDIMGQRVERLPRDLRALGLRYPKALEEEFSERLQAMMVQYLDVSMDALDVRQVLHELFGVIYALDITLPSRWMLLDKALATLAGVALEISPQFNVFETAAPYARRLMTARFQPRRVADRLQEDVGRYASALLDYPFQVQELLEEFKDGEVHIAVDLEELTTASDKALAAANRVAIALIASSVILGSAIVGTFVQSGPELFGLALIGVPGFVAGLALFGWLVLGMARTGNW
jgi:ubiquinone biosynthesis protein